MIGVVYLDLPEPVAASEDLNDVDIILGWDRIGDQVGAPRHVEKLMRLLEGDKPVWYRGGMETVHTAELIMGLGVEKVVIGKGFYKTERMPQHFVRRLVGACVPVVASESDVLIARAAGAQLVWSEGPSLDIPMNKVIAGYEDGTAWGRAVFPEKDA